ncbi:MAG: hypothetical protein KGZ81_13620 [Flavobacteriales bacterium]|nr:hypothetical protein [Flavobacteriales bacterium]
MTKSHLKKFIALITIAMLLIGCSPGTQKPKPEEGGGSKTPEVPKVLEEMESMILETMYAVDSIPGIEKSIEEKNKAKQQEEQETEVKQKKEEKEQQAKKNVDIEMLIEENSVIIPLLKEVEIENTILDISEPPDNTDKHWFDISGTVGDIHRSWNVLEPQLQEAKVTKTLTEEFENKLDEVTEVIGSKKVAEGLMGLNELTRFMADFRSYFKSKVPAEVYKVQFHIREAILYSSADDFDKAMDSTKKSKELGDTLRPRIIEKKGEDVAHKYQLSIEDLEQQLKNKNFPLTQVKGSIVIKNTMLMVDLFESSIK